MKKLLSVYFGDYRTYYSVIEPAQKGYELKYINSSKFILGSHLSKLKSGLEELKLNEFIDEAGDIDGIAYSLPGSLAYTAILPNPKESTVTTEEFVEQSKTLIDLDITLAYPGTTVNDFKAYTIPLIPLKQSKDIMLSVVIKRTLITSLNDLTASLNLAAPIIELAQFNIHSALAYNYPERKKENSVVCTIGQNSLEVSTVHAGIPVYYYSINLYKIEQLSKLIVNEVDKNTKHYLNNIDSVYLCGEGLDYYLADDIKSNLKSIVPNTYQLNAFRMLTTSLGKEHREYCSLMSHVFPACIGAVLPSSHEKNIVLQ